MAWTDLRGWFTADEGAALRSLVAGKTLLELGSWCGRSTVCAAEVAEHVCAVDWFHGDTSCGPADTFEEFYRNIHEAGVAERVTVLISKIEDLNWTPFAHRFDVCFFDSDHTLEAASRDVDICIQCVKPGGVVCWHDAGMPTVDEAIKRAGLTIAGQAGSFAWAFVE